MYLIHWPLEVETVSRKWGSGASGNRSARGAVTRGRSSHARDRGRQTMMRHDPRDGDLFALK